VEPAGELVDVRDEGEAEAGEYAQGRRREELPPQALEAGGRWLGGRSRAQAAASAAVFSARSGYCSKSRIQWLVFLYRSMRRLPIVGYQA